MNELKKGTIFKHENIKDNMLVTKFYRLEKDWAQKYNLLWNGKVLYSIKLLQLMEWEYDSHKLIPIDDFVNRKFFYRDTYKLVPASKKVISSKCAAMYPLLEEPIKCIEYHSYEDAFNEEKHHTYVKYFYKS
tara:strand:+ start:4998 stop:5393 length:396 start_codon:yes stop_codon:yes gene_type:complete